MNSLKMILAVLATAAIGAGQERIAASMRFSRPNTFAPRRLSADATVCVNPPLNLTRWEIDPSKAMRELGDRIREAGFRVGPEQCDATVYTEIVANGRKNLELQFRIVFVDEQIPRLCSAAHGSLLAAFAEEARQIRDAQVKGMAIYRGAVE
ncbi:MAG TPA: hypothetical protein VK752_21950 [Bryobacteraceae bacterium]|jgi:hypothetical protein|nr:hypothetical protein [Bryobacteraceae bacterium]